MSEPAAPIALLIDADACPVKAECYRVAERYGLKVYVVANSWLQVPRDPRIERIVVPSMPDAADDWIAERATPSSIVVTNDVPLAARCLKAGALALAPNGRPFTLDGIGLALANRDLMQALREAGEVAGGPKAFLRQDASRFLSALDQMVVALKRPGRRPPP